MKIKLKVREVSRRFDTEDPEVAIEDRKEIQVTSGTFSFQTDDPDLIEKFTSGTEMEVEITL